MTVTLYHGDCLDVMAETGADSVDTIVTDPPYGLAFMGKDWDHGVPGIRFWQAALRVAKPGAMLLAFGGTRTHHRLMCAIEDAGWEIRDMVMWLYGSGFPKSHDISKAIDKAAGAEREWHKARRNGGGDSSSHVNQLKGREAGVRMVSEPVTPAAIQWDGWGTALKPAWEPIIVAMKPRDGTFAHNALAWGVAGLWVDGGRIEGQVPQTIRGASSHMYGGGDGLCPEGHQESNPHPSGRWPANLILDEEAAAMLDEQGGERSGSHPQTPTHSTNAAFGGGRYDNSSCYADIGGASRFFYCAKASRAERNAGLEGMEEREGGTMDGGHIVSDGRTAPKTGRRAVANHHPTVKPLDLMRYLVRLTRTPTGGVVLDPFMGSGTTGMAAAMEGRDFVGIEMDDDYLEIARRRIEAAQAEMIQQEMAI